MNQRLFSFRFMISFSSNDANCKEQPLTIQAAFIRHFDGGTLMIMTLIWVVALIIVFAVFGLLIWFFKKSYSR